MNNESVAWIDEINTFVLDKDYKQFPKSLQNGMIPLYTHPADLTDEEIKTIYYETGDLFDFARAILRKASDK